MQYFPNGIGFVPTMGALHAGHLSLVRAAKQQCGRVVVSVFVNPTQFEPNEDFEQYPRDEARDHSLLKNLGVDEIWMPTLNEIYPEGIDRVSRIEPPEHLTQILCGQDRPHHFSGVATVVKRLFEQVQPTYVYFGQKDYQQTRVIDWLIRSYFPGIRLHVLPTVRESDGLAMSSRNLYLTPQQREVAPRLWQSLQLLKNHWKNAECRVAVLLEELRSHLRHPEIELIYAEIRSSENLELLEIVERPAVVAVAIRLGKTRLIDNVLLDPLRHHVFVSAIAPHVFGIV